MITILCDLLLCTQRANYVRVCSPAREFLHYLCECHWQRLERQKPELALCYEPMTPAPSCMLLGLADLPADRMPFPALRQDAALPAASLEPESDLPLNPEHTDSIGVKPLPRRSHRRAAMYPDTGLQSSGAVLRAAHAHRSRAVPPIASPPPTPS